MAGIPPDFWSLFWDTAQELLDTEKHKKYIIERVLEYGDEPAFRWLFQQYSDEDIISVVRSSTRLSVRTGLMMANFYGIPKEELECIRIAYRQQL